MRKETETEPWIDRSAARVDGRDVPIDFSNATVVLCVSGDRVMLPLEFISESLGAELGWEPVEQVVSISTFHEP